MPDPIVPTAPKIPKSCLLPKPLDPTRIPLHEFADVGDIVNWFQAGDENQAPRAAMVTAAKDGRVTLNTFDPGLVDAQIMDGVYHADSKVVSEGQRQTLGTWRHRPHHEALIALMVKDKILTFDGVRLKLAKKEVLAEATKPVA